MVLFFFLFLTHTLSAVDFAHRMQFSLEASAFISEDVEPAASLKEDQEHRGARVAVATTPNENGAWTLTFTFPEPLEFTQQIEADTLYLEFNQPVDSKELIKVYDKIGSLIQRFSNGYRSFYFVAHRPVLYSVTQDNQTLSITIAPDLDECLLMTRQAKIALARLYIEKRQYCIAYTTLSALLEEYPEDKDAYVLLASLEGLLPRWQNQVEILGNLSCTYPSDEDLITLFYDAYSPHSSFIREERQMQRTIGLAAVQVYRLQGETIACTTPNNVLYEGANYQLWDGHIASIVNSQGIFEGFRGWRNQLSLYLRNELRDGRIFKGSLYAQKGALGAGLEYSRLVPKIQGRFTTEIEWHRPLWEVFEALAFYGREDRFYSHIEGTYSRHLSWSVGGGARRVGIMGTPTGYTSALANVGIYLSLFIPNPIIGINYNLDAEYVLFEKRKRSANGTVFFPVPYTSFENHTLSAFISYIYRDRWYFSGFAGETFNPRGRNDKTFGAELRYIDNLPYAWEASLSYNYFPSTIVSGATAEFLTGTLILRF